MRSTRSSLLCAALSAVGLAGCEKKSCLSGTDPACVVAAPCEAVRFECAAGSARAYVLGPGDPIPAGLRALASPGDFVLENEGVVAVIDALDHPHHLAPTGGMLLDLARRDGEDGLNQCLVATGLLPDDQAAYGSATLVESGDVHAVILRGTLDGHPDHAIFTRYEIRPCEPGVRARSEVVNLSRDPASWALTDGWFWGGRDYQPFVPLPGSGFEHPDFGLTTVNEVWRDADYLAASDLTRRANSLSVVRCDGPSVSGFHSRTISAAGTPRRAVPPGDYEVYERFIAVAPSEGVAPAIDVALELRRQLHGEPFATVRGSVTPTSAAPLALRYLDGDTPRSAVVLGPDGRFSMRVPAGRAGRVELELFGRAVASADVPAIAEGATAELSLTRPEVATVVLDATIDGAPLDAQVFFTPADAATKDAVTARMLASQLLCAPLLGPVHGASPACNRALTRGPTTVLVPPGRYRVHATAGITASLAEAELELRAGQTTTVSLPLSRLALLPPGVLSADFHVHGGRSFDASIPDRTRVRAFLAAGLDVIAATDHDVVSNYDAALDAEGARDRLTVMTGVETTALVLHRFVPGSSIPKVIGHFNFWPMTLTPSSPYRGGAWDERMEPGRLFATMRRSGLSSDGIIQLNHPFVAPEFGRDLGYPDAIDLETSRGIPASDDGSAQALVSRTPPGGVSNLAYDTQEVMNGTDNLQLLAYRAYWHFLLSQGVRRAGTANSDSHGLSDAVVGTPRSLVFTRAPFEEGRFLADVKAGRVVGTNGPLILASIADVSGATRGPSLEAFQPRPGAKLAIAVRAPSWVPVTEVRIVVDGAITRTLTELSTREASPGVRAALDVELPLSELLPGDGRDHWISIEAGTALPEARDLDCNGIPDTTDNNLDGVIDERDADEYDPASPGEGCDVEIGPARSPPTPSDLDDPLARFAAVTPGGFPFAFTGPLLIDPSGDGFAGAGR